LPHHDQLLEGALHRSAQDAPDDLKTHRRVLAVEQRESIEGGPDDAKPSGPLLRKARRVHAAGFAGSTGWLGREVRDAARTLSETWRRLARAR
jgi:hypothetical protein